MFFDETKNRIVLVFPVNWLENVYAGCFLFYFDVKTFTDELLNDGYVKFSDNLQILSDENYNGGFVIGLPNEETQTFADAIKKSWAGSKKSTPIVSNKNIESIVTQKDGSSWVMMNSKNQKEYKVGFVIPNSYFELPNPVESVLSALHHRFESGVILHGWYGTHQRNARTEHAHELLPHVQLPPYREPVAHYATTALRTQLNAQT